MNSIVSSFPIVLTPDAAGAGTALSARPISGYILEIRAPNAASQLTAGGSADFTITRNADGGTVLSVSNQSAPFSFQPRQVLHTAVGGTATGPAYLDRGVPIDDHLRIVVAQGALSTSGTVFVHVEGRA